ncbi:MULTISPECIES: molybdopterin-dependent oxidoreductase [Microvirga]|uniref:molybdopterin-dependent oxidoreductase n=1 Tax=Microvirga TaxID=186650 RepID=UPI001CFFDBFA|nr:molybdopterin-dependent oxidoreductase [Microvirga lenta]MCB5174827.1 molybdopterin-dependent oxidoreductase [Microvirga lenta]
MIIDYAKRNIVAIAVLLVGFLSVTGAGAETLGTPKEKPILTISGKIGATNKGDTAQFDRPMLEALGMETIETTTPWYNGPVKFEGVSLDKLMKLVGADGQRAVFVALNDYSSEIPIEDFSKHNVILALKRDGEYMPVRDKGPLFVIYPFDSKPELKNQTYYGRSVWQVAKIVVK